jgi:hypothetical protein
VARGLVQVMIAAAGALVGCGARDATNAPADSAGSAMTDAMADAMTDAMADATIDAIRGPAADGPPGVADLQFVDDQMVNSWLVNLVDIYPGDCELVEQCVGASGARLVLRFDTVAVNRGTADVYVGAPPPDGVSNDQFQWSECHHHHHYANFINYELSDATGVVLTARKQSFCLEDSEQVQIGAVATGYTCSNQGISRGWADIYSRYLPCQGIDVTGLPSGSYTLRATVNPLHTLPESNYDNNVFTVPVAF